MNEHELFRHFPNASRSTIKRNAIQGVAQTGGLSSSPQRERSAVPQSVGTNAAPITHQSRRLVRITSYRVRLLDERNLFDKWFVDALVEAAILVDDSPRWAKIEVFQEAIGSGEQERTEIEIEELP